MASGVTPARARYTSPGMAATETITFHVPEDPEFLQAVARVSLVHAHLDYSLRMYIKTLADVSIAEALDATEFEGSRNLRDRIRKLAKPRIGDGQALVKLQALLKRCEDASTMRNDLLHNIIVLADETRPEIRGPDHSWRSLPSAKELNTLARTLTTLAVELNHARLSGWLAEALEKTKAKKLKPAD